ncbi:hypothetical protein FHT40_000513 [Mycolicibacterium sp. BK556]|uniref:hypothetical protein n=1 Tax=Mycobacteriaceae TaxID=1762 RepID=UPI00105F946D|nr:MULTISPECIES: hypothetical protein [Mycobacteriaceae]MBB3600880.1 hypothetical protein [Mycolicibacterium sp. BK556]MBB3630634.1 hypothetical protein [Mycolicibacterium sp. BK607]MBB3748628.1 hypothetical protein [Mycolicibacterium sp. BK634]TDO10422.1 hypothetical protein EV580_4710 [Mycobacterium sp. BK086]
MGVKVVRKTDSQLAARCAAVASIGAAVIHFAVAPMHWTDWKPSGVFFAAIAVFQLFWGFLTWLRPTQILLAAGVAANLGSAALWVMSRTAGAPFGPNAGVPEAVEAAGIAVLLLQCYVIMGAGWALLRRYRGDEISGLGRAVVLMGANAVMAGAVTVGLASGLQGQHHHHGGPAEAEQVPGHHADVTTGHDRHEPAPAPGLPVTDMSLNTEGDHHPESAAPVEADAHQHSHSD